MLRLGRVCVASTNSDTDKRELDRLWQRAAGDVLARPRRADPVSLS